MHFYNLSKNIEEKTFEKSAAAPSILSLCNWFCILIFSKF